MLMVFKGVKQEYVYCADTEYDRMRVIQSAGLIFQRVDERNDIYQLAFSFNFYVKKNKINHYVQEYTGLTPEFLAEKGMELAEFREAYNKVFEDIDPEDTIFIAHGAQADRKVLKNAKVGFTPLHTYCTYKNAKRVLEREGKVSLTDVAAEAGFRVIHEHDAYADALTTAVAFSYLKKIEWQES